MTLGEKVKALRERKGWSQRELAQRAHVRQALLSALETGKQHDTTGSVLRRLAGVLGCTVDYLAGVYNGDAGAMPPDRCPAEGLCLIGLTPLPITTISEEIAAE